MYFLAKILLFSTANPLFFRISATVTTVAIAVNDKRRKFNRNHAKAKKNQYTTNEIRWNDYIM